MDTEDPADRGAAALAKPEKEERVPSDMGERAAPVGASQHSAGANREEWPWPRSTEIDRLALTHPLPARDARVLIVCTCRASWPACPGRRSLVLRVTEGCSRGGGEEKGEKHRPVGARAPVVDISIAPHTHSNAL